MKTHGLFLGVDFDCHLKFNFHIKNISNKISKSVGIIYRLRDFLPKQSLFNLYFSFVYPYLIYCNLVWGGTYACHLNPLIVLQKKLIRIITYQPFLAHTNHLFFQYNILKVPDIHKFMVALYMFKNRHSPIFVRQHNYSTRFRNNLLPVFHRLSITQNSLTHMGPNVWNTLPEEVKTSETFHIFKRRVKKFLLSAYHTES